jgi:hypothetical protein
MNALRKNKKWQVIWDGGSISLQQKFIQRHESIILMLMNETD